MSRQPFRAWFALRKRLDASRWMVAVFAALTDLITSVESSASLGQRWTHWTLGDRLDPMSFTIWGNAFDLQAMTTALLLVSILFAVWRYEQEQRRRQSVLDEEFGNAQELQQVLVPESLAEAEGAAV